MSVTYGFYNSKDGDRKYNAIQMSSIFDGVIRDGVLQHVGTALIVKESEDMIVNVGIGRAWFNHTWTLNDALLPITVSQSEVLLNRYDAVVLEVDSRESVRANTIKIVKGTPASTPAKPTMIKTNDRWQYPLAYIYVRAGVTSIRQSNITNCVGTSECPFVTAPLEKMDIDALIAKWEDQWNEFYSNETKSADNLLQSFTEEFNNWFIQIKDILDGDTAGKLANRIVELQNSVSSLQTEMTSIKKSVSDGKSLVAKAITDKGKATAADASFQTMSDNVRLMAGVQYGYGVTAADARVNTNSASYKQGYSVGYGAGCKTKVLKDYDVVWFWAGASNPAPSGVYTKTFTVPEANEILFAGVEHTRSYSDRPCDIDMNIKISGKNVTITICRYAKDDGETDSNPSGGDSAFDYSGLTVVYR